MEFKKVFYSRGVPLGGILRLPESGAAPYPAIVLCHGHSRHKNDGLDVLAEVLSKRGFASFRFDFRGCAGTIGRFDLLPKRNWMDDLSQAVTFISGEPEIDAARIGAAGISMGGSVVSQAAADDDRIRCTVAMAPVANLARNFTKLWKRNLGQEGYEEMLQILDEDRLSRARTGLSGFISSARICGMAGDAELEYLYENCREQMQGRMNNNYVTLEGVDDTLQFAPEDSAHRIATPIMFVHGADDDLVDPNESRSLYEKVPHDRKKLLLVEGCDHNIPINPKRETIFPQIADWFESYL